MMQITEDAKRARDLKKKIEKFPDGWQVKDLELSLLWLGSLLRHGFDPWPGNSHMLQAQPKTVSQYS